MVWGSENIMITKINAKAPINFVWRVLSFLSGRIILFSKPKVPRFLKVKADKV